MKKRILTILLITLGSIIQVFGYSDVYYMRRTVIQSARGCGPITVEAAMIDSWGNIGSYNNYNVSSGTEWGQRVKIRSARDCNGRSLSVDLDVQTKTEHFPNGTRINNGSVVYYYVKYETYVYDIGISSSGGYSSSSSNSSSSSSSGSSSSRTAEEAGKKIGTAIGNGITSTTKALRQAATANANRPSYTGYRPGGFSLSASVSAAWGENLELRFRYGGIGIGGDLTVMVGYDWIRSDGVLWNIGAGFVYGDELDYQYLWDVGVGFKFGRSYNAGLSFMLDANTTHLVGPKHVFGFTAGAGIGLALGRGFIWDARAGIVIYFLQWDWL